MSEDLTITDIAHALIDGDGGMSIGNHDTLAATLERLDAEGASLVTLAQAIRLDRAFVQPFERRVLS